jgi:hypothetical protein
VRRRAPGTEADFPVSLQFKLASTYRTGSAGLPVGRCYKSSRSNGKGGLALRRRQAVRKFCTWPGSVRNSGPELDELPMSLSLSPRRSLEAVAGPLPARYAFVTYVMRQDDTPMNDAGKT